MIECYKRLNKKERSELFEVVNKHGYQLFYLNDFELFDELREIHIENMVDERHFEILALHKSKKQVYNILYK